MRGREEKRTREENRGENARRKEVITNVSPSKVEGRCNSRCSDEKRGKEERSGE
jgi:hypothetical protein